MPFGTTSPLRSAWRTHGRRDSCRSESSGPVSFAVHGNGQHPGTRGLLIGKHGPHRFQRTFERIEDQAKNLQGDGPKERFVARLPQNDRSMSIALRQGNVTFGNAPLHLGAVGQGKGFSLGLQADGLPILFGKKRVDCAAVDKKFNRCLLPLTTPSMEVKPIRIAFSSGGAGRI